MIRIVIPGEPHAQMRARSRVIVPKSGGKPFAHHYDASESRNWKATAQALMEDAVDGLKPGAVLSSDGVLFQGPVCLRIVAWFACPKSDERKTTPRPVRWNTGRKDCDNIAKAVMDAANGVLWIDDRQVSRLEVTKLIARQGQPARTEIGVEALSGDPIFGAAHT